MADLSTQPPVDDVSDGWVLGLDGGFRLDADPKSRGHHPRHLRQPSLPEQLDALNGCLGVAGYMDLDHEMCQRGHK